MTNPTRYELRTPDGRLLDTFYDVDSARRAQAYWLTQMGRALDVTVRRTENNDLDS